MNCDVETFILSYLILIEESGKIQESQIFSWLQRSNINVILRSDATFMNADIQVL